jgi:hypothetical protein
VDVSSVVAAGAGFLLAVLWFDLMFDVQARGHETQLPEPVLASIAAYYARVTTASRPMNRLVAAVMLATLAAIVIEIADGDSPRWVAWVSLAPAVVAIGLARVRTVPNAVRLGRRVDAPDGQTLLARSILRDHMACFASILTLLVLQLAAA